jgi:hypothetical protein
MSHNIEKPFQIIPENLDGFNQKVNEMSKLTNENIKLILENA